MTASLRAIAPDMGALVADIRREHAAVQEATSVAVAHAIRCGRSLLTAKAELPHGSWTGWLSENVAFSGRTAQAYMRLARKYDTPGKAQCIAGLSLSEALKLLAEPRGERPKLRWQAPPDVDMALEEFAGLLRRRLFLFEYPKRAVLARLTINLIAQWASLRDEADPPLDMYSTEALEKELRFRRQAERLADNAELAEAA